MISGEMSLQGLASRLLAVDDPPGDWTLAARPATPPAMAPATSSAGIMRLRPVALLDLTILDLLRCSLLVTKGLGTPGSTDILCWETVLELMMLGRLVGPDLFIAAATMASVSSTEIENFGTDSLCFLCLRCSCGLTSSLSVWEDSGVDSEVG